MLPVTVCRCVCVLSLNNGTQHGGPGEPGPQPLLDFQNLPESTWLLAIHTPEVQGTCPPPQHSGSTPLPGGTWAAEMLVTLGGLALQARVTPVPY